MIKFEVVVMAVETDKIVELVAKVVMEVKERVKN